MKEFLLVFRADYSAISEASEEMKEQWNSQWMDWINGIVSQGKMAGGNHLGQEGKVLKAGGIVTDGPYAEIKESVLGYIIVQGNSYEEAVELARPCPLLNGEGNSVEVREVRAL